MSRSGRSLLSALLILMSVTAGALIPRVHAAAVAAKEGTGLQRLPESPAPVQNESPEVRELTAKLKALREELHSQLDPLQSQIKALKEKYDPQIEQLEQQRK